MTTAGPGLHDDVNFTVVDNAINQLQKMNQFIETGMTACMDVALDLEESTMDHAEQVNELKDQMKDYVQMERDLTDFTKAVENVKYKIGVTPLGDKIDVETMLKCELQGKAGSSVANFANHQRIQELNEKLWQINHPGETAPSQFTSTNVEDEDLVMSQAPLNTKCPITQQDMVDPVKNKICQHSYERKAILQHIAGGRGKRKCPVAGCGNGKPVEKKHLEDNVALKHTIERRNRLASQRGGHRRK